MRSAEPAAPSERSRQPLSKRALALAFVVAVHLALVVLFLSLNPRAVQLAGETRITAFNLAPVATPKPTPKPEKKKASPAKAKREPQRPRAASPAVTLPPSKSDASKPFTTELFEAVDISKLPNHSAEIAAANAAAASAANSAPVVGTGPDGKPLYNAEWQTEPTRAELAFYLPKTIPAGAVALIVCKTAARFRVEDCQELGENPGGGGLARALRQAAWQFKVRPPRIGGDAQLGVWVRIRFDFTREPDKGTE